jgi:hypothetical protein
MTPCQLTDTIISVFIALGLCTVSAYLLKYGVARVFNGPNGWVGPIAFWFSVFPGAAGAGWLLLIVHPLAFNPVVHLAPCSRMWW